MSNVKSGLRLRGVWTVNHYRGGKLIHTQTYENHITTEGIKRILDVFFGGAGSNNTQTATWYVGLFNTDTTLDGTETYDVPVFTEDTDYDEAARQAYVEAACTAGGVVTNSASPAVFTITTGGQTIYGAALFSINTKGDHTGGTNNVLFCGEKFTTARAAIADDVFSIIYQVAGADA
jgi:hypothetical protein